MIMDLFNKKVQESYGVRLVELNDGQLVLKAPISRTKALKRASRTPVLQFRAPKPGDNNGELKALTHTGFLRSRKATQDASDRSYHFLPLSAALRVSQKDDVDTGRIEVGSIHPAVVFDYDLAGDAGSPLITLSLNPRGIRENLKVKPDRKYEPIENPQHVFQDLKVGDGPFRAKVIRLQQGRALIDMDVGRRLPSEGMVKVLGILPFQASVQIRSSSTVVTNTDDDDDDVEDYDYEDEFGTLEDALFSFDDDDDGEVEEEDDEEEDSLADELLSLRSSESFDDDTFEDDEEEEDISSLYQVNDDGDLTYVDPDTGKMIVMRPDDYDEHDEEEAFEEDDDEDDSVVASLAGEGDDDEDNDNIDTNDDDNDDGDIDFDMSTLFKENDDGSVSFIDPDSGEALEVESGDEEYEDMMMIKSLIDEYTRPPSPKNVDYTYSEEEPSLSKEKKVNQPSPILVSKRLRVGEEVEVFIRTVSKQSGQFTVTTNPTVQGRKAKDLKREGHAIKKLDRLKKSLGGSLQKIWELEGQECFGIVKATSQSGEWCYVQPDLKDLPVGVATLVSGSDAHFSAGDSVRVRIAGVDEERGQLAMHLLGKV